jgi:hypothetical protein
MPYQVQVHESYVHVRWFGVVIAEDLRELGRELPRIGMQLRRAPNVLHTFEEVEATKLNFHTVHNYSAEVGKISIPNSCRVATVASSPISFGIARMFQAMNGNPNIEMELFESLAEAQDWLAGKGS